jgi:hypothetical protein
MGSARPDWRSFKVSEEPARAARRAGGWRAKKSGESAEELVELVGALYLREGRAELRKRPEPYRRVGAAAASGQFTAAPLAKSGPDFDLALPDGRAGLMELKSRKGRRVPLRAVGEAQGEALERRVAWCGFGVVLVCLWDDGVSARWWVVDWRRWREARALGYKSLSCDELDGVGVACALLPGQRPDWLPALLRAHEEAALLSWPPSLSRPRPLSGGEGEGDDADADAADDDDAADDADDADDDDADADADK